MKIILYQPQIPQNTGNIVRTCAATGSDLVLVRPLGFSTSDRWLKRAGLDYWDGVRVDEIDDLVAYLEESDAPFSFFSSNAERVFSEEEYASNHQLIFGSETVGLPQEMWERWPQHFVKLPMVGATRCLNLSNTAAVAIYEAWRQQDFSTRPSCLTLRQPNN